LFSGTFNTFSAFRVTYYFIQHLVIDLETVEGFYILPESFWIICCGEVCY